jgi:hypothetical protein
MPLVIGQMVRVRVAVVLDSTDLSVGQVYDEEAAAWADLVWVDLASSTVMPMEFGNVEFWCEVYSLALTRVTIARPAVRLRAWRSGGAKPDQFEILTSGNANSNVAKVQSGGTDLSTDLPGLGPTLNKVRIKGLRDQRVGWTGRVPGAICWDRTYLAIRKRIRYEAASSYEMEYLSGVSGFAGDLGGFNSWLGSNQPEYGSPITVGATVEVLRTSLSSTWSYRYKYVAVFTLHAYLAYDGSVWSWTTRGAKLAQTVNEVNATVCGGASLSLFYGDAYLPSSANVAGTLAGVHSYGTLSGSFTTPAAGGGTVTASPRGGIYSGGPTYGADITFTVSPQGRVTNVAATGFSSDGTVESVSAWGACKAEGGYLA